MSNDSEIVIHLDSVSKDYKLYPTPLSQAADILGLRKIFFWKKKNEFPIHKALENINLSIKKGQRIGILGRNGAGKSTLLNLITKNFNPTSGNIKVNGKVQSLMNSGVGFHPDYTGYENIMASLIYNDLDKKLIKDIVDDIIDFVELGEYINQPVKTYSSGMLARLGFATATAIAPDILLVDEVLSAGDAYFIAKCRARIINLVKKSKCTLLLVSHSMSQILEFCDYAFWINQGKIFKQGESFEVVKAYEEFMSDEITDNEIFDQNSSDIIKKRNKEIKSNLISNKFFLQEPKFIPHENSSKNISLDYKGFNFVSRGGLSRWGDPKELFFNSFSMANNKKITNNFLAMNNSRFLFSIKSKIKGIFNCRYAVCIYDSNGNLVSDILSSRDSFKAKEIGYERLIELSLIPIQLGPGEYSVSLSLHDYDDLEYFSSTKRYDLLNRSFIFHVKLNETLSSVNSSFFHSGEWKFKSLKD